MRTTLLLLLVALCSPKASIAVLPAKCLSGALWVDIGGTVGYNMYTCGPDDNWNLYGGAPLPTGFMTFVLTGNCPSGFSEVAWLVGKTLIGTNAAAGDVGSTGGADLITPQGTNSGGAVNAHGGTAVADHASHTHTYTDVINHVHLETAPTGQTGSQNSFTRDTSTSGSSNTALSTALPAGGVNVGTTAGPSATLTHSVTQPADHTFTQPTFTGTQFDNRSAWMKVIFCSKD